MTHRRQLTGSVLLSAVLVAATAATPALASAAAHHHKGTKISTVKTKLGRVVSNPKGRVVFRFLKDGHNKSRCKTSCRSIWPPVMTKGAPRAGSHIAAGHLGRTKKGQVTYHGHPLYFFSGNHHPGKTTGDGLKEFGAHWFIVSPGGKSVKPHKQAGGGGGGGGGGYTVPSGPAQVSTGTVSAATVLTNAADQHTVYELSAESGSPANFYCTGTCMQTWHPLLTKGAPTAAGSADAGQLGTTNRSLGGHTYAQVTYDNHPLYTYAGDSAAGQGNGEGVYDPPGYWYEMAPNGQARL